MAFAFDETSGQHILLGDNAALTLPDGDWTIAGWIKLDDNVGSLFQYFLSWGTLSTNPSLNWFFGEASQGALANELRAIIDSDGISEVTLTSTGNPGTSTLWMHLLLQRSGDDFTQYVDNSADGTDNNAFVGVNVADDMYFGMREDGNADRRLGGSMAEWAKWDRVLSAGERAGLAAGFSPMFYTDELKWYAPMVREYQERIVPLTVTNQSSTVVEHPPIIYPAPPMAFGFVAPAVGISMPIVMGQMDQFNGGAFL